MPLVRRFLIASSLVRLLRRARGATPVTEGYLTREPERMAYVRLERDGGHLILITTRPGVEPVVEFTAVSRLQGEVLLDVCAGRVDYERLPLGARDGREIYVDRFRTPAGLDLVRVEFDDPADAAAFAPPVWFGPEVTGQGGYDSRALALDGAPPPAEAPLSDEAVHGVLDLLDELAGPSLFEAAERRAGATDSARAPAEEGADAPADDEVFEEADRGVTSSVHGGLLRGRK